MLILCLLNYGKTISIELNWIEWKLVWVMVLNVLYQKQLLYRPNIKFKYIMPMFSIAVHLQIKGIGCTFMFHVRILFLRIMIYYY